MPFARQRAAMDCAGWLARRLASVDCRAEYAAWRAEFDGVPKSEWVDRLWSTRTVRAMRQFCSGETDNQSLWGAAWTHQLSIQWPKVGGTLQSVTSHESVLLVDAALL